MIYNHPIGNIEVVYKWYILLIGDLHITYHLLREPGNSIDQILFWSRDMVGADMLEDIMGTVTDERRGRDRGIQRWR